MKNIFKSKWFWALSGIIVLFFIILIASSDGEKRQPSTTQQKPTQKIQEQSQKTNEEKFGLTEKERKEVFLEIVKAEDKARKEAQEKYPTPFGENLRVGQTYQLSKKTSLMPELEPADPIAALSNIKEIPIGGTVKIIKITIKENTPWYYVDAQGIGEGWINSVALIGQFEKEEMEQLDNQLELERTLTEKYKKEVAKEYSLTDEQLQQISIEGVKKNWPMPKL